MDIEIPQPKSNRRVILATVVAVAAIFIAALLLQPNASTKVQANDIWTGQVKRGDMALSVAGFGYLKSRQPRLLAAQSQATVEQILHRPGSAVGASDVLIKLSDPESSLALRSAELQLQQQNNQYQQQVLNQSREKLAQQSDFAALQSQLESAQLEVTAQRPLFEKGIVSALDYQRSQLLADQLTRRVSIEQQRMEQLDSLHQKALVIAQSNIDAQHAIYQVAKQRVDALQVKAGIDGVVQSLNVELGQTVNIGQILTMVGSTTDLYALINIPQNQLEQVKMNQTASIDTRAGVIPGTVVRIDPVITSGTVQVEVALTGKLTENARPELNIQGVVATGMRKNVLYIDKPANVSAFTQSQLYQLAADGDQGVLTEVNFGAETMDTIELVSGAEFNQRFILSDMSKWHQHSIINIL